MKKDYTGQKFNFLTAIEPVGRMRNRGSICWKFLCDCGTEKILDPYSVAIGHIKSCGCMQKSLLHPHKLAPGEASFRQLYRSYRQAAELRGYSFDLNQDEFRYITKQFCYYCGCPPTQKYLTGNENSTPYTYNGVDRIDNSIGYISENVVPCCGSCNSMKTDMPLIEFAKKIRSIYENRFGMLEDIA